MTLKSLRTTYGLTQADISRIFGIPKRTIENWEGGKNKCPEYLLRLIAYYLDKEYQRSI